MSKFVEVRESAEADEFIVTFYDQMNGRNYYFRVNFPFPEQVRDVEFIKSFRGLSVLTKPEEMKYPREIPKADLND